jgi:hypothetical protein
MASIYWDEENAKLYLFNLITQLWQDVTVPGSLSKLQDVSFSTLINGQVLKYNSSSGKWENQEESGGEGEQNGNLDGGQADSNYGGIDSIDGGGAA